MRYSDLTKIGCYCYIVDLDSCEPQPIPDAEAVKTVQAIAAKQREALENAIRPNDAAAPVDTGTPAAAPAAAAA
jgi:hypothetical protein